MSGDPQGVEQELENTAQKMEDDGLSCTVGAAYGHDRGGSGESGCRW